MATWYNLTYAYKEVLTSVKMTRLDGNLDALAEGASGAPVIAKLNGQLPSYYLARANHTGTQALATITGHDKATHDALNIDSDTLDTFHASDFSLLQYSGATVFASAAAPAAWTDLDLSGTIGSNRALILLKIENDAGVDNYTFRENGDTTSAIDKSGVGNCIGLTDGQSAYVWMLTDAGGIVEWISQNQQNTIIYLMAYLVVA